MEIKVAELDDKPLRLEFQIAHADFSRLEAEWEFKQMTCFAELTRKGEVFYLSGKYDVHIQTACNLCLQTVTVHLANEFDLSLMGAEERIEPDSDFEISVHGSNMDYYEGQTIQLSQYFKDQLLLDLPLSVRCQDECQGICQSCGANKNTEACNCPAERGSNPFSILKDLKPDHE